MFTHRRPGAHLDPIKFCQTMRRALLHAEIAEQNPTSTEEPVEVPFPARDAPFYMQVLSAKMCEKSVKRGLGKCERPGCFYCTFLKRKEAEELSEELEKLMEKLNTEEPGVVNATDEEVRNCLREIELENAQRESNREDRKNRLEKAEQVNVREEAELLEVDPVQ